MPTPTDPFTLLQADIAERLRAHDALVDVGILTEREKDITSNLTKLLNTLVTQNGKCGMALVVQSFSLGATKPNLRTFDDVRITVTAFENLLSNTGATGVGITALYGCVAACEALWGYRPIGLAEAMYPETNAIRPIPGRNDNEVSYQLGIVVRPVTPLRARVATPVISPDDLAAPQTVTITCATAGAAIYYTLDDTHPWSGNAAAVLYTVPFVVAAAASIRAIAYKTNLIASDSALANIT